MQLKNKKRPVLLLFAALASFLLFSYSSPRGGDVVRIYLNNTLVMEQFMWNAKEVKSIDIHDAKPTDQLAVHYSHCGQLGTHRSITIKNDQNQVLKKWQYADKGKFLICQVKDISGLQKKAGTLRIFYSSQELPDGKWVASVKPESNQVLP